MRYRLKKKKLVATNFGPLFIRPKNKQRPRRSFFTVTVEKSHIAQLYGTYASCFHWYELNEECKRSLLIKMQCEMSLCHVYMIRQYFVLQLHLTFISHQESRPIIQFKCLILHVCVRDLQDLTCALAVEAVG
jgi:hypothetical protein